MHQEVVTAYRKSEYHNTRSTPQRRQSQGHISSTPYTQRPSPFQVYTSASTTPLNSGSRSNSLTSIVYNNDTSLIHSQNQPLSPTGSQSEATFSPTMSRSRHESSSTSSPRSRQEIRDSNVQFTSSTNTFENVKLQAMQLWTTGVDLEMQQVDITPKKKPNNIWLSNSEWGAASAWTTSTPSDKQQQSSSSIATEHPSNTTSTSSHSAHNQSLPQKQQQQLHEPIMIRSFAETASKANEIKQSQPDDTAWSPEQEDTNEYIQPSPPPTPYNQHHTNGLNNHAPRMGRSQPATTTTNSHINALAPPPLMMMVPNNTHPMHIGVGKIPMLDRKVDRRMYQDLYLIESNLMVSKTLAQFYQNLDEFSRQSPRMSSRTFGMLIKTINAIALLEKRSSQSSGIVEKNVFNRLIPNLAYFMQQALQGYLEFEVLTPIEMMPVLELCSKFAAACPHWANRIPLNLIQQSYEHIKFVFNQQDRSKAKALLDDIGLSMKPEHTGVWRSRAATSSAKGQNKSMNDTATSVNNSTATPSMQSSGRGREGLDLESSKNRFGDVDWGTDRVGSSAGTDGADEWWQSMPELPSLPDGKELLQQVESRMKRKTDGQLVFAKDPLLSQIVNKVHQSDFPKVHAYLMIQYMLLFEEMCGPIQEAMEYYLEKTTGAGYNNTITPKTQEMGGCIMYSDLTIHGTTLFPTVNEPVIVLHAYSYSDVMPRTPKEGSFAVLIKDNQAQNSLQALHFARPTMTSHHDTASVLTGTIVYSTIKKSSANQQERPRVIIGVHLKESQLSMVDWTGQYTLMATGANAAAIMPVLNWYHLHYEQSDDILTHLAGRLLTPISKHARTGEQMEDLPDYLTQLDVDLDCIATPQFQGLKVHFGLRGKRSSTVWPTHPEKYQALHPSHRPPLYVLSPTQWSAVQHAMTHRISVISGGEGTGKTFLASKLVQLLYKALVDGQCFQPILILTKNETTLDSILDQVIKQIPDLVRLGKVLTQTSDISERHVLKVAAFNATDQNRKFTFRMERRLADIQSRMDALWRYRQKVLNADPDVMVTAIPPHYVIALRSGYMQRMNIVAQPSKDYPLEEIWQLWMGSRDTARQTPGFASTYQTINKADVHETGQRIPPIMEWDYFRGRRSNIENRKARVGSISVAEEWPFPKTKPGSHIRMEMKNAWTSASKPNQVWNLSTDQKRQLQQRIIDSLVKAIDDHINELLTEQVQAAKIVEDARLSKWTSICRFSRVVGVTADFAAANAKVIESLWPRVIIMDEAQSILESIAAPFVFGSRVQHVVMIGDAHARQRPQIHNAKLKGEPKHLDMSLFERWRLGGGYISRLEEQWRMCSDIVGIHDSLATPDADRRLLITAPIAGENKGDHCILPLLGLEERAYLLDYQEQSGEEQMDPQARHIIPGLDIKNTDADEARFVAHLAFYLYQQSYKSKDITVLTVSSAQKILINMALQELINSSPAFTFNNNNRHNQDNFIANVDMVDHYVGKESHFVILSLAMPCGQPIPEGNISLALSRARSGLYIVGRISELQTTGWSSVVKYMKGRGICGPTLKLKCQIHPDQITHVGKLEDFQNVKNGGCLQPCNRLFDCGHNCGEASHHLNHTHTICLKQCTRDRPEGCTHPCPNKCSQCHLKCPPCGTITKMERSCGHMVTGPCQNLLNLIQTKPCREQVVHILPCGHEQRVECHLVSNPNIKRHVTCREWVKKTLSCGHTVEHQCCYEPICTEYCPERLDCGHPCPERCGTDHRLHKRAVCTASCSKQLICGHYCAKGCANPDDHTDRCLEQCQYVCCHGYACGRLCWKVCTLCVEDCPYNCEHLQCTKKCHEKCDRPPCNKRCSKALDCGHLCIGLCGEPCPPCKECDSEKTCSISLRALSEFEDDELVYMLPECGCVFSVDSLDLYFKNQAKNGEHTAIKLWQCPSCRKPIYTALRYNMYIKTEIALVNQIKAQQEESRHQISQEEKTNIIQAMNEETKSSINNIVGGRWFVCENGHPYFIGDCGGATQISSCPHCGAVIGGLQHKVVESNRFYGEFDGSFKPAWPGQPE